MTIEQKINQKFLEAYKNKQMDIKNFIGILKGEIENIKKNIKVETLPDAEAIKYLTKTAKGIKENIELTNEQKFHDELAIVESFLPIEMTKEEIVSKLEQLHSSGVTSMGDIMKSFSNDLVDRKLLSELVKQKNINMN